MGRGVGGAAEVGNIYQVLLFFILMAAHSLDVKIETETKNFKTETQIESHSSLSQPC